MRRTPAVIRVADCWHLRAPERHLLVLALTAIALGYLMLLGARPKEGLTVAMPDLAPVLLWATAFIGVHLWLVLARFRGDQLILPVAAFLCGIGLLAQFRMGIFDGLRSGPLGLAILPTAVALMVLLAHSGQRGRYHRLAVGQWLWALLSLALLAILFATGQRFRGAVYGTGFLTPTEALKLSLILFAAAFVARHAKALAAWYGPLPPLRVLWPLLVIWLSVTALLLLKRDLGLVLILTLVLMLTALLAMLLAFNAARRLSQPIRELAVATEEIAAGRFPEELSVASRDELGFLVQSFNVMTRELAASRKALEAQRRYLEVVLGRLSAGVLAINSDGRLGAFNDSAGRILQLDMEADHGRTLTELQADRPDLAPLLQMIASRRGGPGGDWRQEIQLGRPERPLVLVCRGSELPPRLAVRWLSLMM
jgi:HAMP domain-containing protein